MSSHSTREDKSLIAIYKLGRIITSPAYINLIRKRLDLVEICESDTGRITSIIDGIKLPFTGSYTIIKETLRFQKRVLKFLGCSAGALFNLNKEARKEYRILSKRYAGKSLLSVGTLTIFPIIYTVDSVCAFIGSIFFPSFWCKKNKVQFKLEEKVLQKITNFELNNSIYGKRFDRAVSNEFKKLLRSHPSPYVILPEQLENFRKQHPNPMNIWALQKSYPLFLGKIIKVPSKALVIIQTVKIIVCYFPDVVLPSLNRLSVLNSPASSSKRLNTPASSSQRPEPNPVIRPPFPERGIPPRLLTNEMPKTKARIVIK